MKKFQIIIKPMKPAIGSSPRWSFYAHGATVTAGEAVQVIEKQKLYGYFCRKLKV